MEKFDTVCGVFVQSMQETAAEQGIELMDDAIYTARSQFIRTCLDCGVPNKATAVEVGKRYVLEMIKSSPC